MRTSSIFNTQHVATRRKRVAKRAQHSFYSHSFYGPNCTKDMFDHLDSLTVDEDGDDRRVVVVFHNFKGYDGCLCCSCTNTTVKSKIRSPSSRWNRTISPSRTLCSLPFPLAIFPATFGLTELRKGFLPHLLNTLENQDYHGSILPASNNVAICCVQMLRSFGRSLQMLGQQCCDMLCWYVAIIWMEL